MKKKKLAPKKKITYKQVPYDYQIILTENKKQIKYIGSFRSIISTEKAFLKLIDNNSKNIHFPVRYVNSGKKIKEVEYELLILKLENDKEFQNDPHLLMNSIGKYVQTEVNNRYNDSSKYGRQNTKNYSIYNKGLYNIEETFWVYGFHPYYQRKTADDIFNMYINEFKGKHTYLNKITCFKNKLLIEDENETMNMIICKNINDCVRLYTYLEEKSKENKIKYILWNGIYYKSMVPMWVRKIQNLTNWKYTKIMRSSTRP